MVMSLDDAIRHAEEVAEEQEKLCKRYDDASGYTRSHNENIRTFDAKKCEKCSSEYRQVAEWLKDYKRLLEREACEDAISRSDILKRCQIVINLGFPNKDGYHMVSAETIMDVVKQLPSVNPQPKTGHCRDCMW